MTQSEPRNPLLPTPAMQRRRWHPVGNRPRTEVQPYSQGALALTFPMPSGIDAEPRSAALWAVAEASDATHAVPDPEAWAARFLQAVVEVVSSDRPLAQLARWTDPLVFAEISRRRDRVAVVRSSTPVRAGRQQVATVHICRPSVRTAEVAARVTAGQRSRALAARLDYRRDRWLCTALDFG